MSLLLEKAEGLVPLWDSIGAKLELFRAHRGHSLSNGEGQYVEILSRYVAAVRKTVAFLVGRQKLLNAGSKRNWKGYRSKTAEYDAAVQEYMAIGRELNAASPVIFSFNLTRS
jgi:hypothetical protein